MAKELQTIVIDAGHGGTENIGGSSPNNAKGANGLLEKYVALDIARRTAAILVEDADIMLTRSEDINLPLAERAAVGYRNRASIFLSLHFNGSRDASVGGTEMFIASNANAASQRLARHVLDALVTVTGGPDRGIQRAGFDVLTPDRHWPETAACLAEIAFLTHPAQARRLEDPAYRQQIAVALREAILKHPVHASFASQCYSLGTGCANPVDIGRDEKYAEFALMQVQSDRLNRRENIFLRWGNIPQNTCVLDVVVHFHGYNVTGETKFFEYLVRNSGLDLLKPDNTVARTHPTLCILPFGKFIERLPDSRQKYGFPFFTSRDDGPSKLIEFSLNELASRYQLPAGTFTPGRLILTAHSGGGAGVSRILAKQIDKVDEVHLFDSTYGSQETITKWATKKMKDEVQGVSTGRQSTNGALRVLYLPVSNNCNKSGTADGSQQIERALREFTSRYPQLRSRYRVEPTRIRHTAIPRTFGFQLLADAEATMDDSFGRNAISPCCINSPEKCRFMEQTQSLAYEKPDYLAESEAKLMST